MDFSQTRQVSVDPERLRELAVQMAASAGFRIEPTAGASVELSGAGMYSSRQNPLCGASRIRWVHDYSSVTLEAELGGARWMANFVRIFPLALSMGLILVLTIVFAVVLAPEQLDMAGMALGAMAILDGALWMILGPIMARGIENRTRQALDSYFTNVVALASRST